MLLKLLVKRNDDTLIAKISAYSLESFYEQMHKIEKIIKKGKEKEKEIVSETCRDEYVNYHREQLEKVFHEDNPEITKDNFQNKFDDMILNANLADLIKIFNRA